MRIGIDIMGGDYAPRAVVLGAIAAYKLLSPDQKLVLIGDQEQAFSLIKAEGLDPDQLFEFVHCSEVIGMGEHPTKAIGQKPDASINVGFSLLKEGKIDSFASAGNTGAMLVGAMFSVKVTPGVLRPAIVSNVPKEKEGFGVLLDVGASADCKPEFLLQFAILGSLYAEHVYKIPNPKVGLINLGEEEEKGKQLTLASFPLLKENKQINFVGNIEGRDLFNTKADIMVTDGFTGNVVLKLAESFYDLAIRKGFKDSFIDRFNYEQYGGSPIIGVNAPVITGHGISSPEAIKNMILLSRTMIESKIVDKINVAFN